MKGASWLVRAVVVLVALALYVYAASIQLYRVNTDLEQSDQGSYMGYAIKLKESGFTYVGDRNRMPLFPALSSVLYRDGMSEEEFFLRGKWFNVGLSVALLGVLWAIFQRHLSPHGAANLLAITAFTLFVFKAPCFQGELLYYTLSFVAYWLLSRLFVRPKVTTGLLAGGMLAAAHLTKASALGVLGAFFSVVVISLAFTYGRGARSPWDAIGRALRSPLATASALCLCTFVVLVSPYLIHSKRQYGRFFYNVNTTFYLWYDSWDEAKEGTRAHGDRKGWPDMPPEEIPSLTRYLQTHTWREIAQRELNGVQRLVRDRVGSYGYFKYAVAALVLALVLAWRRRSVAWDALRRYRWVALFWLVYLVGFFLSYAWWVPISPAPRLVLALFVPYMWSMALIIRQLLNGTTAIALGSHSCSPALLLNVGVSALLLVDVALIVTGRVAQHYGCT